LVPKDIFEKELSAAQLVRITLAFSDPRFSIPLACSHSPPRLRTTTCKWKGTEKERQGNEKGDKGRNIKRGARKVNWKYRDEGGVISMGNIKPKAEGE